MEKATSYITQTSRQRVGQVPQQRQRRLEQRTVGQSGAAFVHLDRDLDVISPDRRGLPLVGRPALLNFT